MDFVPASGGSIAVRVEEQGEMALFSVQDNGPGIPADKTDDLFKKFCQLDTSEARKHDGTIGIDKSFAKDFLVKFTLSKGGSR